MGVGFEDEVGGLMSGAERSAGGSRPSRFVRWRTRAEMAMSRPGALASWPARMTATAAIAMPTVLGMVLAPTRELLPAYVSAFSAVVMLAVTLAMFWHSSTLSKRPATPAVVAAMRDACGPELWAEMCGQLAAHRRIAATNVDEPFTRSELFSAYGLAVREVQERAGCAANMALHDGRTSALG